MLFYFWLTKLKSIAVLAIRQPNQRHFQELELNHFHPETSNLEHLGSPLKVYTLLTLYFPGTIVLHLNEDCCNSMISRQTLPSFIIIFASGS